MSSFLLTTKLYMPPTRSSLVQRSRLTSRLTEGLSRPLTVISAPAGFGKTTLLAEWRGTPAGRNLPLGWLSLDADDSDPPRFWAYAVAALRTLPAFSDAAALGRTSLELLRTAPGAPPRLYLPPLLHELAAAPEPFALVLDDYHTIESPAIHTAVQFMIDHLPPGMRLVVLTRADPPWPLARLRSQGLLAEFRAADLRFTNEEATAFLGRALDGGLPAEDVAALQERTEGWPAALHMAALSLAGQAGPAGRHAFVASFAGEHRHIADYLAEEVIARQPEPVQTFLLRTSVLERMTAPLCAAVTGQAEAAGLLEHVDRANLFLVPLDDERRWFRYHHLFADLLRARLRRVEPDLAPVLCRRASDWHEAAGHPIPAVTYALAGNDHDRAARLVEQNVHGWWGLASGDFLRLMARLPVQVIHSRPTLSVYQAWVCIVTGRLDAAAVLLEAAEHGLGSAPAPGPDGELAALRGFVALMHTYVLELTRQPYTLPAAVLEAPGHIPAAQVAMRNSADVVLSFLLYINGDLDRAAALLSDAARRDLAANLTNAVPIAISRLARIRMIQGRLPEAADICRRHLALIAGRGEDRHFVNGSLHTALADALREMNDLSAAEAHVREAVAQNEAWQIPDALASALLVQARVLLARGDAEGASAALARAAESTRGRTVMTDLVHLHHAVQVQLWLREGNVAAARQWAAEAGLSAGDTLSFRQEPEHMALARILLADGHSAEAQGLLSRLAVAAANGGRTGRLTEILALQALALHQSDPERAVNTLEHALVLAEPSGCVRIFLDEGLPLTGLLRRLAGRSGAAQAFAARLLDDRSEPHQTPVERLPEPLTDRELEVLRLLVAGLSNQEMAARLVLTVGTVKTHVHNIYSKLGVTGRVRAIARARELGLM